ncbi:MAG: hypothetical protein KF830_12655 [Planctomycetes bacterium]|nr:hypothetical protein [Planctomycetota bacterium]
MALLCAGALVLLASVAYWWLVPKGEAPRVRRLGGEINPSSVTNSESLPSKDSPLRAPVDADPAGASHVPERGQRSISVSATNLSGDFLPTARVQHLATMHRTPGEAASRGDPVPALVGSWLRSTIAANGPAPSRLRLAPEELPCFVLLEAEDCEVTLLHLGAGEADGEIAVPLRDGTQLEIDAGLLRASSFDSGLLTVWPTVLAADGSWSPQDLVLTPRARNRWGVAVRKELRVTESARVLEGLPIGQTFVAHLEDDRRRVSFEPLQVAAPARLDFVWRRAEGCTLVFSAPLPTAGTVVFTPEDRRPDEPLLGGDLSLPEGAMSAFVPCAVGRPWFLDGCGAGWQFAAPLVVQASRDDTAHAVDLRDPTQILVIVAEGGLNPDDVQILFAKGSPERREFERVTFDPMVRGPRAVRDARGWIVRDLPPATSLHAYLEPCNAVLPLDAAGRSSVVMRLPQSRPSFRVPDAERDILRAELHSVPEGDPWVHLDQWLPLQDGGAWYATTGCSLPREQLLTGTVPLAGLVGARYRLRIRLPGREHIVPLE